MRSKYIDIFQYCEETLQINILHFGVIEKSMLQETSSLSAKFSRVFLPVSTKRHAYSLGVGLTKNNLKSEFKIGINT